MLHSPRPGAGLKAWDTVLHYEAVIREEEDEKFKKQDEKRVEREKYGLKGNMPSPGRLNTDHTDRGYSERPELNENFPDETCNRRGGKGREGIESDGRGGGLLGWNSCRKCCVYIAPRTRTEKDPLCR